MMYFDSEIIQFILAVILISCICAFNFFVLKDITKNKKDEKKKNEKAKKRTDNEA